MSLLLIPQTSDEYLPSVRLSSFLQQYKDKTTFSSRWVGARLQHRLWAVSWELAVRQYTVYTYTVYTIYSKADTRVT